MPALATEKISTAMRTPHRFIPPPRELSLDVRSATNNANFDDRHDEHASVVGAFFSPIPCGATDCRPRATEVQQRSDDPKTCAISECSQRLNATIRRSLRR